MSMMLLGASCGCVRWVGMPTLPSDMVNHTELYGIGKKEWGRNVAKARTIVRSATADFNWLLAGTASERLVRAEEVRAAFAGVIFVGDSQIREVSWAGLKLLVPNAQLRFADGDPVFTGGRGGKKNNELRNTCVPQSVGKTGFTATCNGIGSAAAACQLHSPFHNKSHAEAMRKLLLTRPHDWDGALSLSEAACSTEFFVSYQATWGAIPVQPFTLPRCMHPRSADDTFGVARAGGARKPVLWIMDGGGLHEMEFCDPRRWSLPQHVLRLFPDAVLRSSVVWQPAGGGFQMRISKRFKGECATIDAHMVAAKEIAYLDQRGVRHYDYPGLALQFAPLMFDAIHFTYYWVPCRQAFPEMARLVAQLALQQAMRLPVQMCRTADELARPVDTAAGLSFEVPLGIGEPLPSQASAGGAASAAAGKASGKATGKAAAKATAKGALLKARAKAALDAAGRGARKDHALCDNDGLTGGVRALCEENAALRSANAAMRRSVGK